MTVAISKALRGGRDGGHLRVDRQHQRVGRRLRRQGRPRVRRARAARPDRRRQARPGDRARRPAAAGRGRLRRLPPGWPATSPTSYPVSLVNSVNAVPDRGPEDRGVRGRRRPRPGARRALPAGRQRGQHHGLLAGLRRVRRRRAAASGRGCGASRPRAPRRSCRGTGSLDPDTVATRDPDRRPGVVGTAPWPRATSPAAVIDAVTDEQILDAQRLLPPARASSSSRPARPRSPGCCSATSTVLLDPGQLVVCTVTGNGLKDIETALRGHHDRDRRPCPPTSRRPRPRLGL